jgi:hypothetical protein
MTTLPLIPQMTTWATAAGSASRPSDLVLGSSAGRVGNQPTNRKL